MRQPPPPGAHGPAAQRSVLHHDHSTCAVAREPGGLRPQVSQPAAPSLAPGDPAFIAAPAVIADLQQVDVTLCRAIQAAEDGGRLHLIPPLVAQRTRAIEARARAGQVGGFSARDGQTKATASTFSVTFNFTGAGRKEQFAGFVPAPVIEAEPEPEPEPVDPAQDATPHGQDDFIASHAAHPLAKPPSAALLRLWATAPTVPLG